MKNFAASKSSFKLTPPTFICVCLWLFSLAFANAQEVEKDAEENGLRLEVTGGVRYSFYVEAGTEPSRWVEVSAVLRNISDHTLKVGVGPLERGDRNIPLVVYALEPVKLSSGELVRLPDSYYNFVSLMPGEVTILAGASYEVDIEEDIPEIDVKYIVFEELKEVYPDLWTGWLETKIQVVDESQEEVRELMRD